MKKLFLVSLAILLTVGIAHAVSFPQSEDAKNGPGIWYVPVYNNTSALSKGDVVVWDIASSPGDNDNYITTTTTSDTFIVAGVVWPFAIGAGGRGTIAVKGVVDVNTESDGGGISTATANWLLCTGNTAGRAQVCSDLVTDPNSFGFTTAARSDTVVKSYIIGR